MTARIGQTVANRKLGLVLLGGFAVLALVLASLGVYSVMAHLVAPGGPGRYSATGLAVRSTSVKVEIRWEWDFALRE